MNKKNRKNIYCIYFIIFICIKCIYIQIYCINNTLISCTLRSLHPRIRYPEEINKIVKLYIYATLKLQFLRSSNRIILRLGFEPV